jgi:hypothetical protein
MTAQEQLKEKHGYVRCVSMIAESAILCGGFGLVRENDLKRETRPWLQTG